MTHKERFENLGIAPPKGIMLLDMIKTCHLLFVSALRISFEAGTCINNLVCNRRVTDLIHSVTLNAACSQ